MKAPFTKIYGMFSGLPFPEIRNIRKAFFYKNIRNFSILEVESSIFQNIRKYKNFFHGKIVYILSLGLKVFWAAPYITTNITYIEVKTLYLPLK